MTPNFIRSRNWFRAQSLLKDFVRADTVRTQVAATTVTNVALMLTGVVSGILVARYLGPTGRGELAAIQLWPAFLAIVAMFGIPEALSYYSASDPANRGRYLTTAVLIALCSSLVFAAVAYVLLPLLLSSQSSDLIRASRFYLLLLPLMALAGIAPHVLRGSGRLNEWNLLRLLPTAGWLLAVVVVAVAGIATPAILALSYLVVLALLCVPSNLFVLRRVSSPYRVAAPLARRLAQYGFPSMLGSVPQLFNLRLDQMLMATFMPAQQLGLYVVAVAWGGGLTPLMTSLGFVLFPRIASESSATARIDVLGRGARICVVLGLTLCLLVVPVTPFVMPLLFGSSFRPAVPSAMILVVAAAILGFNYLLEEGVRALGRPSAVLWGELGGLLISALALFILLPLLGILGAAVASLLGYTVIAALLLYQLKRQTGASAAFFLRPSRTEFEVLRREISSLFQKMTFGPDPSDT